MLPCPCIRRPVGRLHSARRVGSSSESQIPDTRTSTCAACDKGSSNINDSFVMWKYRTSNLNHLEVTIDTGRMCNSLVARSPCFGLAVIVCRTPDARVHDTATFGRDAWRTVNHVTLFFRCPRVIWRKQSSPELDERVASKKVHKKNSDL